MARHDGSACLRRRMGVSAAIVPRIIPCPLQCVSSSCFRDSLACLRPRCLPGEGQWRSRRCRSGENPQAMMGQASRKTGQVSHADGEAWSSPRGDRATNRARTGLPAPMTARCGRPARPRGASARAKQARAFAPAGHGACRHMPPFWRKSTLLAASTKARHRGSSRAVSSPAQRASQPMEGGMTSRPA